MTIGMTAAGLILAGYLIGGVPFGLLVGLVRGTDIRRHGSGNIGATNVGRVLGKGYGIAVFALDLLKGLGPVVVCGQVLRGDGLLARACADSAMLYLLWIGVGTACILGHMFPVYLGFKGGKGVATSLGVLLGIYPYYTFAGLVAFGLWVLVTGVTRYVSAGSIGAAVAFPIVFAGLAAWQSATWGGMDRLWPLHLFGIMIASLVIYRHRGNVQRLRAGTESKIGGSKSPSN